jgi:hypothetical protein
MDKKYEHNKKQIKEYENTIIEKDEKIKFMELQKKNEDLCSKIENDLPTSGYNELGGLEDGQNLMDNLDDSRVEPES